MTLNREATDVAQLDAVCDQFERALRDGDIRYDDVESRIQWADKVAPQLRTWLLEELTAICSDFDPSQDGDSALALSVDRELWDAVIRSPTFRTLSHDAKLSLAQNIHDVDFPDGAHLLKAGEPPQGIFLLTAGNVRIMSGEGDRELDTDGPGAVLGEMSTLTGYPCGANVLADGSVRAFVLRPDSYQELRAAHPEVEIALSQLVSDRLGHRQRDSLCGKQLGDFRLGECLGKGAMGVVYAATDERDGSQCALKMLRHRFIYDEKVISRFDQETELLGRLRHPNIVSMRGHFVAYRTRFVVLERFDGFDLRNLIRRCGPLPEETVRRILGQIASGLQYAHRHGVLHLDLKPANLLIDRSGRVAITDFGLSRLIESDGGDRERVGTPIYMPPEQFTMSDVGKHCDWYSFGCIAYELLTGRRLFDTDESTRFLEQKLREPSASWPSISASDEFSEMIRAALSPTISTRRLNLVNISQWAGGVPELMGALSVNQDSDADHAER